MIIKYGMMSDEHLLNYMKYLISRIYKILPMQEEGCETLIEYMEDLCHELIGNSEMIEELKWDGNFLILMGNIQYLIKDENYKEHKTCKSKVFSSIDAINKIIDNFK